MLRSIAIVLGLAVVTPLAADVTDAIAQPDPAGFAPRPPPDDQPGTMRRPEHLTARPSGFWTSNRPAVGGAYRWRIMGMGILALAITAFFLVRMLRRVSAARGVGPLMRTRPSQK